jgi:hypothetical protein
MHGTPSRRSRRSSAPDAPRQAGVGPRPLRESDLPPAHEEAKNLRRPIRIGRGSAFRRVVCHGGERCGHRWACWARVGAPAGAAAARARAARRVTTAQAGSVEPRQLLVVDGELRSAGISRSGRSRFSWPCSTLKWRLAEPPLRRAMIAEARCASQVRRSRSREQAIWTARGTDRPGEVRRFTAIAPADRHPAQARRVLLEAGQPRRLDRGSLIGESGHSGGGRNSGRGPPSSCPVSSISRTGKAGLEILDPCRNRIRSRAIDAYRARSRSRMTTGSSGRTSKSPRAPCGGDLRRWWRPRLVGSSEQRLERATGASVNEQAGG